MDRKEAVKKTLEIGGIEDSVQVFTRIGQAKKFIKEQPIFYDKSGLWWFWNKDKIMWERVDEVDILNEICQKMNIDVINSKSRTEILNSLKQVGRQNIPKPVKETWIQFKDIIVDVNSGKEFKASHNYFVTNPIPWELHKMRFIETPVMDKIFEEWVGKEYVKTLYEIIAYCLLPNYPINRLFCLIGSGLNGKSKFLELLRRFVGNENVCATELDLLINSRFEVTRLHKKLVCIMGETNFNEMSKTSIIKKLTGKDVVGFEYKNKNPFEDINYAKILIATNNLPTTTDKTIGFYRRWLIIDFPNQFDEKKDILDDIPNEEYEILAVKSLIILKDLLEKREFYNEGCIEDRMKKYEKKSDFFKTFLNEFVEEEPDGYITKKDFFIKFNEWCKENRFRQISEGTIGKKMKENGVETTKKYFDWLYDGKGGQLRVWRSIKWKE